MGLHAAAGDLPGGLTHPKGPQGKVTHTLSFYRVVLGPPQTAFEGSSNPTIL
jgi:hypothetical protein